MIRRMLGSFLVGLLLILSIATSAAANPPAHAEGPPVGGCPPAGGWTLRPITEPGAPDEADINGDGWLCGKDVEIPAFPGFDNYVDNVVEFTA
jgi:hypothetical protein